MQIVFDSDSVFFDLIDCEIAPIYQKIVSHLRHIDIPFRQWDNPFQISDCVNGLITHARNLGLQIDQARCQAQDQSYLNWLHKIYEQRYDGDPRWLDFHEHIHLCERREQSHQYLQIDFREKAGLLEIPFQQHWLKNSTTKIRTGDVFVHWAELGKIPYVYWLDREPNDIGRIKELCKPWLKLRPMILVAFEDYDYLTVSNEFDQWWQKYHDEWCQHWGLHKWNLIDTPQGA